MYKKIAALWLGLMLMLSIIVIIIEIAPKVEAPTTLYVGGTGGDNYTSIQDAIIASSDGDTIRVYDGTYYEAILVDKRVNLIGNGSKKTIIDGGWPDHQNVVTITTSWVNMSGFGIINSYMTHEFGGIGVYSSNNRIFDNHCQNNLYGIIIWVGQNRLCNNSFSNNERDGIFVKSSGNVIENNTCSNSFDGDGIWLYICTDNIVSNNTCSNNSKNGISFYQSHNNHLFNNKCNDSFLYDGILIYESSNNVLWNNTLWSNNRGGFALSHFADNNTLTNNIITENQIGVNIYDNCDLNTVQHNNISNNGDGIILKSSSNNTIRGNTVSNNQFGIYLESSSNNTITDNTVSKNDDGIALYSFSDKNSVMNNYVKSNNWNGIYLDWSSNNSIIANMILLNKQHGISLYYSSNNRIFHNNIIGNVIQAVDNMNDNFWNDTYPSGGNYWDDLFPVVDEYWGPLQNTLGSDGINDSAYIIDIDTQDNYPLLNPVGNYTFLYEGWNLISIPLIQSNKNLGFALNSISGSYDSVRWYNASDTNDPWKHNCTLKPPYMNDLDTLDHTMGFWIHVTEPRGVLFEYFGTQPLQNQTITLHPGWNQVGYPSLARYNRTKGLNNLTFGIHIDSIWTYNSAMQIWNELGSSGHFEPGRGYWVHSKATETWIVPL